MPDPEQLAREDIDRQLSLAGWVVQDRQHLNLFAGNGIAIREVSIPGAGEADYLLIANRRAIGIIEAKPKGTTLTGTEIQTAKYAQDLPEHIRAWRLPLPMLYESTGTETRFTNLLDPEPRSRRVFTFHRPETLVNWVDPATGTTASRTAAEERDAYDAGLSTLAGRFSILPRALDDPKLWPAQREAITNLEQSFRQNRPRALIQMATGSGKTFTAISAIYRLIRHAGAQRILFLVDRANLGRQTFNEFQQYVTPDDGRKFTELYNVQHLRSNKIDPVARVCISTIQRLFSILSGEESFDESLEEGSRFDAVNQIAPPRVVSYNPAIPIETFDIIVIDEAHRSIYNQWRQVLEYFDSYLVGLTATPNKQAFAFFDQNLVMEYSHDRAVIDGVNVPFEVYPIRTRITTEGSNVEAGFEIDYRNKQTRQVRWQALDEELTYSAQQLDRDVVAIDQIRTVIRTFRDRLFTEIFPGRTEVPKTLIFAKDDSHADDIVRIVREEFAKGNDFCQKITYRTTGIKPEDLLAQFRNNYNPRIVVTVDMIATGTDVKPIEIVMFMRMVKSRNYFEQMKGRGVRVMPTDDLRRVTKDAPGKTHFVIIDAVGISETELTDSPPLERKRSIGFAKLLEQVAWGHTDSETISSLAYRLSKLDKTITPQERTQITTASNGQPLGELIGQMIAALDPDAHIQHARDLAGLPPVAMPEPEQIAAAREEMLETAVLPIAANLELRTVLADIQRHSEQIIDTISQDEVLEAGFSAEATERNRAMVRDFRKYIEEHQDDITALQVLYHRPYAAQLNFQDIRQLADAIQAPPRSWTIDGLWRAYQQLDKSRVRGSGNRVLTDIVSLVRFAIERDEELKPFPEQVNERFTSWLTAQEANGKHFTSEQRQWLELIRDHIAQSYAIDKEDLEDVPFNQHGGLGRLHQLFGSEYSHILDELNQVLAA